MKKNNIRKRNLREDKEVLRHASQFNMGCVNDEPRHMAAIEAAIFYFLKLTCRIHHFQGRPKVKPFCQGTQ